MSTQQDHVALDSICSINPPLGLKPPAETAVTYLPMEHIAEGGGQLQAETRRRDAIPNGLTTFQNGDVLIAKITPCFENMKGWLAQGLCSGVGFGSTELHVIRAGPKVLPRIIYAHSLSPRFRRLGARFMTGSAGQQRVSADFLRAYRILLPSLAAQHRIASIDEQLESALRSVDALIAAKRAQKRGLMQQLLTGKVRFPGFTDPWKTVRLGDVADVRFSNVDKHTIPGERQVRLCNYTDVFRNRFLHPDMDFMSASATAREIEKLDCRLETSQLQRTLRPPTRSVSPH